MIKDSKIVIRLDAGNVFGLGHLSRCMSIANHFSDQTILYIIKSDNKVLVEEFVKSNSKNKYAFLFLDVNIDTQSELNIIEEAYTHNTILIIDHYQADEEYQYNLFCKNVKWLQLDSHAKTNFYATWVMHGSPGATKEMYEPLRKNDQTKFLLGPSYCIIKDKLLEFDREVRTDLKKIIICFGGGNDNGATLESLKNFDFNLLQGIQFFVSVSKYNKDYHEIERLCEQKLVNLIRQEELHFKMKDCDLALIAPGMISYESAYLGLPMLLVTIADNQVINSKAWEGMGCAINIGSVNQIKTKLNQEIIKLLNQPERLHNMSRNCLQLVDGKGIERIIKEISN